MNTPERAPLPADHPLVPHMRALDRAWAAAVAEQERLTGEPFIPTPLAPLVVNDTQTLPTPIATGNPTRKSA